MFNAAVVVVAIVVAVAVAVFVAVIMLYDDASHCLGKAIIIMQMWKSKNVEILSSIILLISFLCDQDPGDILSPGSCHSKK